MKLPTKQPFGNGVCRLSPDTAMVRSVYRIPASAAIRLKPCSLLLHVQATKFTIK